MHDALEQFPEDPKLAEREFAEKWLRSEWIYMNQKEQDEYILLYGTRKQRKALKERQKARASAEAEQVSVRAVSDSPWPR